MKTDALAFALGQTIYFKQKPEVSGMVTGIIFRPSGFGYYVTWSSDMDERFHYEIELTHEKAYVASDV